MECLARAAIVTCLVVGLCGCDEDLTSQVPPQDLASDNRDSMSLRLELFVADVQRSVDFYTGVLGFELEGTDPSYAPVRAGNVIIGLGPRSGLPDGHHFNPQIGEERSGLGTEIVLEVDDIENYYGAVLDSGHAIDVPLKERPWGATDFRVVDPDGYYLRLTSRD